MAKQGPGGTEGDKKEGLLHNDDDDEPSSEDIVGEEKLDERASELEQRAKHVSGRAAQLAANEDSLREDIRYIVGAVRDLEKKARANGDRSVRERVLRRVEGLDSILLGAGPGGDLRAHLQDEQKGNFIRLMLGNEASVTSPPRQEARLRLKEGYYRFRDITTSVFILFPAIVQLALRFAPASVSAFVAQAYAAWLLWFYTALALRENVLRCNGSNIRPWWVRHHYFAASMATVALTTPPGDDVVKESFFRPYSMAAVAQGLVMVLQNRYQRRRMYTRIALGKSSSMDVVASEASGVSGQLKLLYPLLLLVQVALGLVAWQCFVATNRMLASNRMLWQIPFMGLLLSVLSVGNLSSLLSTLREKRAKKTERF